MKKTNLIAVKVLAPNANGEIVETTEMHPNGFQPVPATENSADRAVKRIIRELMDDYPQSDYDDIRELPHLEHVSDERLEKCYYEVLS